MDRKGGPIAVRESRVAFRPVVRSVVRRGGGVRRLPLAGLALALVVPAACSPGPRAAPLSVPFETARIWIVTGPDSIPLTIEVASTPAQWERGLMGRDTLDPEGGLLFVFDEPRGAEDGFWMWQTFLPLELATLDAQGRITVILEMEPCLERDPEACTEYLPGVPHSAALEVNRGWFARNGVEVGARVVIPGS